MASFRQTIESSKPIFEPGPCHRLSCILLGPSFVQMTSFGIMKAVSFRPTPSSMPPRLMLKGFNRRSNGFCVCMMVDRIVGEPKHEGLEQSR